MTVSIGIPFTGSNTQTFENAVRSVFSQTHDDWHLVLVNDGADVALVERALTIADERVEMVNDGARLGLSQRLNQIAERTRTPILFRMDADDIMTPDRVAVQLAQFAEFPGVDIVGTRAYLIDENNRLWGGFRERSLPDSHLGFLRSHAFTHPTIAGRREWFLSNPYSDEFRRAEDKELWLRTSQISRFMKIADRTLFYRVPLVTDLAKSGATARDDRGVIRRYGPAIAGRLATTRMLGSSHARQLAVRVTTNVGMGSILYSRKCEPLLASEIDDARVALAVALGTRVPGWPDSVPR